MCDLFNRLYSDSHVHQSSSSSHPHHRHSWRVKKLLTPSIRKILNCTLRSRVSRVRRIAQVTDFEHLLLAELELMLQYHQGTQLITCSTLDIMQSTQSESETGLNRSVALFGLCWLELDGFSLLILLVGALADLEYIQCFSVLFCNKCGSW